MGGKNMFVYSIRERTTGKILSMKAGGGCYYNRRGDAENKIGNPHSNMEVVTFEMVEVPNNTVKQKNFRYCYKLNNRKKIFSMRNRAWNPDEYKMYMLVEV
jgi:hypothetical protein